MYMYLISHLEQGLYFYVIIEWCIITMATIKWIDFSLIFD